MTKLKTLAAEWLATADAFTEAYPKSAAIIALIVGFILGVALF